jgi:hypothetical protein
MRLKKNAKNYYYLNQTLPILYRQTQILSLFSQKYQFLATNAMRAREKREKREKAENNRKISFTSSSRHHTKQVSLLWCS